MGQDFFIRIIKGLIIEQNEGSALKLPAGNLSPAPHLTGLRPFESYYYETVNKLVEAQESNIGGLGQAFHVL
ncbi:hypothetical protein ASN18_0800 [Candidatus Magnetominusculus xianensis]|uniref:Uncharacterized protein n=1 Tax=Candidatus Magnetominusculus xianensis TaxID=1748249 RepID=A0ABR5SHN0_9BACT|nr:hypothetical protein ASN18_0800 [Candidatus Magnetominusculus xianensis]